MEGLVYKSTGSHYITKATDGIFWRCTIRGKLKIDHHITSSNPIAVGDHVVFDIENEAEKQGVITQIKPRLNYIVRESPHNRKHHQHIIGSNLDQAIIVATIVQPITSFGFIDRFLVTAEAYHIPAVILFNKADLHTDAILEAYEYTKEIYEQIGYKVAAISTLDAACMSDLKELLQDKVSLLSGHSGVGKSSIINLLDPNRDLKVQEVSDWSGKGKHTTTFAEMMDLEFGGQIIDTPGVKEFGIVNINKEELAHYFPEIKAHIHNCRFNNCIHINEPGCAVKVAVESGEISEDRYVSYQNILASLPEVIY